MKDRVLCHYALSFYLGAAVLGGCGGSQPVSPSSRLAQAPVPPIRTVPHSIEAASSFKTLYYFGFRKKDGTDPLASLIRVNGALYGTTANGGEHKLGTVFTVTTAGVEQTLYSFKRPPLHGSHPNASVIDVNGTLYGYTSRGGEYGYGTVFRVSIRGGERVIHSFAGGSDGNEPVQRLLDVNGTLYGATEFGGAGCQSSVACGTVFSLTPSGSEHVLHTFGSGNDGARPDSGLIDVNGTLYGSTQYGGAYGTGTVYSISTSGSEQVLHSFGNGSDGRTPSGGLVDVNGTLYGTTAAGGSYGGGTVFSISTVGTEQVLHSFGYGYDGTDPAGGLIQVSGTLYGTTYTGGAYGCGEPPSCGTIFSASTTGSEKVLHSFSYTDGANPVAGLTALHGTLYGTTPIAADNGGTVFSLKP